MNGRNKPMPENISANRTAEFWQRVNKGARAECWSWLLCTDGKYGKFSIGHSEYKASRVAYYLTSGTDPGDLDVCHTCDNPICCNPFHLFVGTRSENLKDMARKGRRIYKAAKGEQQPTAKLTESAVLEIRRRYADGGIEQRELAREYKVARSLISRVLKGTQWAHVSGGTAVLPPANQRVLMLTRRLKETLGAELQRAERYGFVVVLHNVKRQYQSLRDIRRDLFGEVIPSHHTHRRVSYHK